MLDKYHILKEHIWNTSIFESIINLTLFVLIFILYIIVFGRVGKYVKFHFIKRHIYLIGPVDKQNKGDGWYMIGIYFEFLYKYAFYHITFDKIVEYLYNHCYFKFKNKVYPPDIESLSWDIRNNIHRQPPMYPSNFAGSLAIDYKRIYNVLWFIITKGHYILILILILYDTIYNNYQIELIFKFLPLIFIYARSMELWDEKTIIIDGDFYDYERFKNIYKYYIAVGFVKNANYTS